MEMKLGDATEILKRTPAVLAGMVRGLPKQWVFATEGGDTWSPYDVVGHLIHGEVTDWMQRARRILEHGESRAFERFDRTAMMRAKKKPIGDLLAEFAKLRARNLRELKALRLREKDFARTGMHPALGRVTLGQLIATWAVHDLTHLTQICRVLAKQYDAEVGPWKAYLGVLNR